MDALLTPEQIAAKLGVKLSTIYQWTHQGFIPYVKLGRLVRFREADVTRWLEARSTSGRRTRRVSLGQIGLSSYET